MAGWGGVGKSRVRQKQGTSKVGYVKNLENPGVTATPGAPTSLRSAALSSMNLFDTPRTAGLRAG